MFRLRLIAFGILFAQAWRAETVFAQTVLTADGQTDTYTLINNAFGGTAEETPDCSHPSFGPHITQSFDGALGKWVFDFNIHVTPDNDRCINFDRQRLEIKTNSPNSIIAFQGDSMDSRWVFRLDGGFQPSPSFTHIHQIKALDGNNGAPLITLSPRSGSPTNILQIITFNDAGSESVLSSTDLTPFLGTWVEAHEQVTLDWMGSYSLTITRVSDGVTLFTYSNNSVQLWRTNSTRMRGKWGIYRSLNSSSFLRDEDVRYAGFCVAKVPAVCSSLVAPDFSLSVSPSSQTLSAGGSTSYTASVSPLSGFGGTVNLSVNGLPSGAVGTFNPTSISGGSGSSTLNVTTPTSTAAGTYTLTITGASGSLSHSSAVTLVVNPASTLPPGWTDSDIGTPGLAGSATFNSGTFTVNGGGADIWSTSDNFHYAYVSIAGDVTVTARVASQQNTNAWAKSGVMIRESTAANAAFVHVFVTPGNGVNMQYRSSTGASAVQLAQIGGPVAPYWVSLVRSGSTFTGFASAGGSWTQVGAISGTMASTALEGLSVTAHDNTALNSSTFDNVAVSTPAPDFTLSATPSSQTITVGGNTSYTASVSPLGGFAGTVSLGVTGLPMGATGTFTPTSIGGGSGSSTLNITTSSSTPASTYTLTITGTSGSLSHSTAVTLVVNTSCVIGSAGDGWHNTALSAAQTGTFTAQYDATPSASPLNAVVALSQGAQTAYTGFATLTRFNPSGNIDARNGGAYAALSTIPYSGGMSYHFRLVINVPSHTYSIFVTPSGGAEQTLGSNFAFRTEQSAVTALDWWGLDVNASNPGSLTTCNFSVQ